MSIAMQRPATSGNSGSARIKPISVPGSGSATAAAPTAAASSPSPAVSASGRPSRNVFRPNYAEASDESLGAGSGRKRRANSFSPAAPRSVHRPKSLLALLKRSADSSSKSNSKKKKGSGSDDDDEEDDEDDAQSADDDDQVKSKVVKSLDFSAKKKTQSGPSPKFVTHFVIACEQICLLEPALLSAFHTAISKHLPLTPSDLPRIIASMEKVFSPRIVERIQTQLHALGPHGAPNEVLVHKSARSPMLSQCSKCKSRSSWLTTICTGCKKHGEGVLQLLPYLDWSKAVQKQQELDADAARSAGEKARKQAEKQAEKAASMGSDVESSPSPSSASPSPTPDFPASSASAPAAPSSPHKRQKATPHASPASALAASSASASAAKKSAASASLSDTDQPSAQWIETAREQLCLRSIAFIRQIMLKCSKEHFAFSGGDIIFLLRNAIFKGTGVVSAAARECVGAMLERWDDSKCTILSDNSEPAHVMVYAECLHAKMEMDWKGPAGFKLDDAVAALRSAVASHSAEDILRFDATRFHNTLPTQSYCRPCGEFQKGSKGGVCPNEGCGRLLTAEDDFEFLCESLVWTSLFRELGLNPVQTADAEVSFECILRLIKCMRPYRSLEDRGIDSFKLQCYFLTHLTFVLTKWGACAMQPRSLFIEEYLFLLANMDVVIRMDDAELVGEFLQALHILAVPHSSAVMQKGYHYLISHERKGTMRGNWVQSSAPFYQKYHAAYCGIIGLAEFVFDPKESFPKEFAKFFE